MLCCVSQSIWDARDLSLASPMLVTGGSESARGRPEAEKEIGLSSPRDLDTTMELDNNKTNT